MTALDMGGRNKAWPHWRTPAWFMDLVRQVNPLVALDPCDHPYSHTGATLSFTGTEGRDGLARDWYRELCAANREDGIVYVNPPYNKMREWVNKMVEEAEQGCEILALVPSRTSPQWFHDLCEPFTRGVFWRGRIQFENPPPGDDGGRSRVENFVAYSGLRADRFEKVFGPYGLVVR